NWASDVSEARRSRQERRDSGGEKEASGVGVDPMGNKSGYGSEPGYRGDVEFGYGDEYDDEEEDVKLLFWGDCLGMRLGPSFLGRVDDSERLARDFYTIINERDLAPLWDVDLGGRVNGAVETCRGDDEWVMSKRLRNFFNFSHPLIAKHLDPEECAWAYGMNVFDLQAWRKTDIRETHHSWLKEAWENDLDLKFKVPNPIQHRYLNGI
ncbi:hypothetical protein HID58_048298, partial [Brassica napus]